MLTFKPFSQELHQWKVEEIKMMLEDMKRIVQLRLDEVGRQGERAEREQQEWEQQQKWEAQELLVAQQEQRLEELENWKREWDSWDIDQDPSSWKEILVEMQRKQMQETRDRIAWERLTTPMRFQPEWHAQTREVKEWTQRLDKKVDLEEEHKKRIQTRLEELDLLELDLLANIWMKWQEDELQGLDGDTLDQLRRQARWSSPKLMDKITANETSFVARSPYLDALLIFAGFFSGIPCAFLIDIRRGLQEKLLLEILHPLQNTQTPIQPTLAALVNGLWFSSLTASMMGALTVLLAKSLGRWAISKKEAEIIFRSPEYPRRRYREIQHLHMHSFFERKLISLTNIASTLIYIAVILFFTGLLFTTQKSIGISFLILMSTAGSLIFGIALHYVYAFYAHA